ncbi:hypothetical protein HG531_007569 [Fusarium graminearum]|nr:hypothetical protein HG531_007569 [Fusarium graminearum]
MDRSEGDGGGEEDKTGDSNRQLVEGTDHGVGGGRGDSDAPSRAVRDKDSSKTRVDDTDHHAVATILGEVLGQVGAGPVLSDEREEDEHGDGEEVVVVHGVPIFEVHLVNDLAHAKDVRGRADNVHGHPKVTGVQGRKRIGITRGGTVITRDGALDISPGSNNGAENHETERGESSRRDRATEPDHGNGGETVGENRERSAVLNSGHEASGLRREGISARATANEGVVLLLAVTDIVLVGDLGHLGHEVVVLLVLVGHDYVGTSIVNGEVL